MALEQRNKIVALQSDLTNSEEVQRDFVRLSQSLQQELERIRESGTLVIEEMLIILNIFLINFIKGIVYITYHYMLHFNASHFLLRQIIL